MTLETSEGRHSGIILPTEFSSLPEICRHQGREVLARAGNFERRQPWRSVRTPEELNSIIPGVREITQRLLDGLRPFREDTWGKAFENNDGLDFTAWRAVREAGREAAAEALMDAVKKMERRSLNPITISPDKYPLEAWRDWITATYFSVVADRPGFEKNPFLQMAKLYQLGLNHLFFYEIRDFPGDEVEEKALLHFPLLVDNATSVSCLAFGDGKEGDTKVFYYHGLGDSCRQIKPLIPLRTIL